MVREDLSLPQQAVQAIHAAIEATRTFLSPEETHPHVVLCTVPSEQALMRAMHRLSARDIQFKHFIEPDIGNEITALATAPLSGQDRKAFSNYPLLKQGGESNGNEYVHSKSSRETSRTTTEQV